MTSTLKTLFACVVLYVLFCLYVTANAGTKISISFDPPLGTKIKKTDFREVLAVYDSGNGTSTAVITACGTTITAVVSNDALMKKDEDVITALNEAMKKACAP